MEKKPKKINFDDQILQLPEELVHRILCCLPLKDLVRTSILSKRWEKTWIIACGTLQFKCKFFERSYFCRASEEEINAKREELMEFVERTLHSCYMQMVSINNLELSPTFYNSKTATFLDRCIGHAIGCNVRKLNIYNASPGNCMYHNLPQTVLAAKSITELTLGRCSLGSSACSNIDMPSLKTLDLYSVCIGDHTIQNLLATFPVIEKLILRGKCSTSKGTLKIVSLVNPKLVMVEIDNHGFERIEIEAMGLQSFSLLDENRESSCIPPCELNISACKNMTTLELQGDTISEKMINYNLSKLCLLETLKIRKCNEWKTIKISSCRSICAKDVIFPKEIREVLVSPLCNVEHLILESNQKLQTQAVEEIVDGFLWFSLHPLTIFISLESYREDNGTLGLKFLYNKEINTDGNSCCCSSLRIRCWRHSLAEIKMECSEGGVDDEDKKNIRSFLDKKILKNIGGVTN